MGNRFNLKKKMTLAIITIAVLLSASTVFISYETYSNSFDEHYQDLSWNIASTAAQMVNAEAVEEFKNEVFEIYSQEIAPEFETEDEYYEYLSQYESLLDEDYYEIFETLDKIKNENNVLYMYICYLDAESMTAVYLVDADTSEYACPTGTWDIIYPDNYENMENPELGFPSYITTTEEYGTLSSAAVAIVSDSGEVVGHVFVDVSMDSVVEQRMEFLILLLSIIVAVTILLIVLLNIIVNKILVKPIDIITKETKTFIETDRISDSLLFINTNDEIEVLAKAVNQMEISIVEYVRNITAITAEKERIGAELNVATNIQASMLPSIFPAFPERPEFDIYATMTPAKEVGGDFYDFFLIDDNHLAMVMADVSGKGVPAALFMVIAKTLLKNAAQSGLSTKEILEKVNNQLCENNEAGMFVTVWMGIMDIQSGKVICANAGHEYPAIKRANGEFELLKDRHGFVLAGMEGARYREYEIQLEENDILYVYTDGVAEATDANDVLFGTERMIESLNANNETNPEKILIDMKKDIDIFVGEAPQFDDITMLCIKYKIKGE